MLEDPVEIGYSFFPLKTGQYRIYDVKKIEYVFSGNNDTSIYQLKEVIVESYTDLSSGTSFVVNRYKRKDASVSWQIDSIWTSRVNTHYAVVTEHNIPKMKIVFPVENNKTWNGNALNNLIEDEYRMINIGDTYTVNNTGYSNTITIEQEDLDDVIVKTDLRKEIFADSIGLIYKENVILNFCTEASCIGQEKIETGIDYRQYLIEYGEE